MATPDPKWDKIALKFLKKAIKFNSVVELAAALSLDPHTVRKILDGRKPNYLTQLKVEAFVNEHK